MKILQVCPGDYVSGVGGVSEHVVRVSEGLVARGHDVTVFATNPGNLAWFEIVKGVKVRRFRRFAPGEAYFLSPAMFIAFLSAANFEVVHAHNFHAFPMHFARLIKCNRFVVTTHFHGSGHSIFRDSLLKLFQFFGWRTLLKAHIVVAVSNFEKSLLLERFRLDEHKVIMIPNGVNFKEFRGLLRHNRGFRSILYVGRLEEYKGVHYLVEVLPKLSNDVILEVVGGGSLREFLAKRARQLGVSNRVRFYQNLDRQNLLQLFTNADVFVLLSKHEAYGLVVAEALATGLPCILTNTSGLTEWIDNTSCFGVSYPIKLGDLVELIRFVLVNEIRKRDFSIELFNDKILDWKEVVRRLEDIYLVREGLN